MDAFLAYEDSLRALRHVRRSDTLALVPCDGDTIAADHGRVDAAALERALAPVLPASDRARRVALRFAGDERRSQLARVRAVPNLDVLGEGSYLEVVTADGGPLDVRGTSRVFVEAPPLALMGAARLLAWHVREGRISRDVALIRLSALAMELCGTYARDPDEPRAGKVAHNLEPIGCVDDARAWLGEARALHGLGMARRAAAYANDGSNSAMETLWYLTFCLPPRLGGLHLPRPLQNVPLDWPAAARDLVSHERMRPDFYWPAYATACEHLGGDHESMEAVIEDSDRARDYELCHIAYLPLTKGDVRSERTVRFALAQLVATIVPHETAAFARRMRRLLSDPEVMAARRVLLAQLLPPRSRWAE